MLGRIASDDMLSAAQVCRVYATAGMAVVWGPTDLRRHATLLDEHRAICEADLAAAKRFWSRAIWMTVGVGLLSLVNVGVMLAIYLMR